jgi:hypothetical protein
LGIQLLVTSSPGVADRHGSRWPYDRWLLERNAGPPFEYARLAERLSGFHTLVRHHYDYYKFHGNMLIAVAFWIVVRHLVPGQTTLRIDSLDVLAGILLVVLFVGSRDNLRNYYERTSMLLGKTRKPRGRAASIRR